MAKTKSKPKPEPKKPTKKRTPAKGKPKAPAEPSANGSGYTADPAITWGNGPGFSDRFRDSKKPQEWREPMGWLADLETRVSSLEKRRRRTTGAVGAAAK